MSQQPLVKANPKENEDSAKVKLLLPLLPRVNRLRTRRQIEASHKAKAKERR